MSTDDSAPYELHLLETPTLQSERYLWHDPVQAVLGYNRLALEARRPAVLTRGRTLEGEAAEIIDSYSPSETAPPIRYRLGKARPAFTEPAPKVERSETATHGRGELARSWTAAYYYALGWVEAIGPLGPFSEKDAIAFAEQYMPGDGVPTSWATWSAQRRQEAGL